MVIYIKFGCNAIRRIPEMNEWTYSDFYLERGGNLHPFDYAKPTSLAEARTLLAQTAADGVVLAGGSDVLRRIEEEVIRPQVLIDIKGLPELRGISFSVHGGLSLGATTTISALAAHNDVRRHYSLLVKASHQLGSLRIRNRATVGGNICVALPQTDLPPALLCYDATCHLLGPEGERTVPLSECYKGTRQIALEPGELLVRVTLPAPAAYSYGAYHTVRQGGQTTVVGAAVLARRASGPSTEWRIALAAAAPYPLRAYEAETHLASAEPDAAMVEKAAELAMRAAQPADDIRASARYRRSMVGVLVRRGIEEVIEQLSGRGR